MIPIPKVKSATTSNEYRPVALTSAICKEFESIIVREILDHTKQLRKTNNQYGFLPGRNTMDALIEDWENQETKRKQHTPFFFILKNLSTLWTIKSY